MADGEMRIESPEWMTYHEMTVDRGDLEIEDSNLILRAAQSGPPELCKIAYSVCSTRKRHFNPGLKGTNSIEATLLDYGAEGDYLVTEGKIAEYEDPTGKSYRAVSGNYQRGWGINISNYHHFVWSKNQTDRGVQIHFDWWDKLGLTFWMVRDLLPEDVERYPTWDPQIQTPEEVFEMGEKGPILGTNQENQPVATLLGMRWFPPNDDRLNTPIGHRYGLVLTDDGNTAYWTLDGNEMDRADTTGFFGSNPDAFSDGAYATIGGGGDYEQNVFKVGNVSLRHSSY